MVNAQCLALERRFLLPSAQERTSMPLQSVAPRPCSAAGRKKRLPSRHLRATYNSVYRHKKNKLLYYHLGGTELNNYTASSLSRQPDSEIINC